MAFYLLPKNVSKVMAVDAPNPILRRRFGYGTAIFPPLPFACPPCVLVGALCVPCAEVLLDRFHAVPLIHLHPILGI